MGEDGFDRIEDWSASQLEGSQQRFWWTKTQCWCWIHKRLYTISLTIGRMRGRINNWWRLTMLTAIPEVDLGMKCVLIYLQSYSFAIDIITWRTRLKDFEKTKKAKRVVAKERQERKKSSNDEYHLVASCCESSCTQLSDASINLCSLSPTPWGMRN